MSKVSIFGVNIDAVPMDEALNILKGFLDNEVRGNVIFTPNSEIVMSAKEDEDFKAILNSASLIVPDGIGVVKAGKILGTPIPERVGGFDLSSNIMPYLNEKKKSLFILGGKPSVAEKAAENLKAQYPDLVIAGTNDGYFNDDEKIVEKIAATCCDFLMVCLGSPKQEEFIYKYKDRLFAKAIIGAGGSADVFAGEVMRAPEFYIKHNLEWLYRIVKGKRLKRSLKLFKFAFSVYLSKFRNNH